MTKDLALIKTLHKFKVGDIVEISDGIGIIVHVENFYFKAYDEETHYYSFINIKTNHEWYEHWNNVRKWYYKL